MAENTCKALTISKIKRYRENVVKTFSPKLVLNTFIASMRDESFPTEDAALSIVASFILDGDAYEEFLAKSLDDKKAFFAGTDALTKDIVGSAPGFNTYQAILDTLQGIESKSANIVITTEKGAGLKQDKTTTTKDDGTTIELADTLGEEVVIQKPLTGFLALKSKRVQGTFLLSSDSVDYWVPFFESYFPAQIGLAMEFKELVTDRINDALVDISTTGKGFTEDVDASLTRLKNLVKRNLKNRSATAYSSPDFLKTLATNTDLKAKYFDDIFLLEFDFIVANLTKNVAVSEKKTREANQVVEGFYNEANFPFKGLVLNIKDIKKEFTPGEAKDQFIVGEGMNPIIVSLDVDSHSLINSINLRRRSIYHSSVDNKYFYFPRRVGADPIEVSPELKYDFSSMSSANKNSIDHHVSGFDNHTAFINNIFSMFRRIETDSDGEIVFKERMSKRDFDILAPKLVNAGTDAKDFLDSLRTLAKERDTEQGILANSLLIQIFSPQNSAKYGIKSIQSIINREGPWTKSVNINVLNSLRVALTSKENLQYLKVEEGSTTVTKKITDTSFSNDANNIVASLLLDNTKTKPAIAELVKVAADQRSFQVHHNGRVYQSGEIKDIASVLDVADAMGILNSFEKIYNTIMGTSKDTTSKEESVRHLFKTLLTIAATNKETTPLKTEKISNEFASDLYSATPFDSVASIEHIKVVAKAFNADAARSLAIANKMTSVISAPSREAAMPRQIAKYDAFNAIAIDKVGFSPFLHGTDPSIVKATVSDTVLKSSIVKEGVEFNFSSWDLKIREEHAMIHGFINGSTELGNNFLIQDVNYSNKTTPLFKRVSLEGLNVLTNNKETRELLIDNYINYVARKNEDMQRIMIRDVAEYVLGNFSRLANAKIAQGKDDEVSAMYELKELLKKPLAGATGDMTKPINLLLQKARLSASEVLQSSANIDKDADYIELNTLKDIFILKPNAGVRAAFYRDPVMARDIVNKTLLTNRARLQELGLNRDSSDMTTVAAALKMAVEKTTKGNSVAMVTDAQEFYDRYFLVNGVYGHALKVMSLGDETYYGGRYNYDTVEQYYDSVDVGEVDGLEEHNKMLITQFKRAQTLLTRGSAYSTKVTMEGFKRSQRRDNTIYYAEAVGDFDVKTGAVENYIFPRLAGKTITELAGLEVIEPFSDGTLVHIERVDGNEIYSAKFIVGKNEVTIRTDESRSKLTDYSYENALKTLLVNSVAATKASLADQDMVTDISVSPVEIVARPLKSREGNITLSRFKEVLKEQVTDFQVVLPDVAHSITMEEPVSYVDVLNAMGVKQDNSDGVQFIHPLMHMYLGRARGGDLAAFNTEDFTALKFLTTTFEYNKFRQVIGKKSIQYPFSFEQFKKFGSVSMYNAFKKMNTAVSFPQPKMRTSMEPGAPMIIANNMQELFEQVAVSLPTGYTDERKIWGKIMDILSINQRNMYSFVGYVTLPSGQKTGLKKVNPIDKIFSGTKEAAYSEVVLDQIDHEYHYEVLTKDHEYDVTPNSGKRSTIKLLSQLVTAISFGGLSTEDNMKLHAAIEGTVGVNTATLNWKYIKIATALRDKAPAIKKPLYNVVIERFNQNQLGFDDVTDEIADVIEDIFKASVIDMAERTLSKDKPAALGKIVRTVSDVMGVSLEDKLSLDGPMTKNDVVNALRSALYSDDVQIHLPGFIAAATTNNKVVSMFTSANGTRLSRQAFIEEAFKTGVEGTGAEIVEITAENFNEYKDLILPFDLISIETPKRTIFREMGIITPAVFSKYPVIKAVITPDVAIIGKSAIGKEAFLNEVDSALGQLETTDTPESDVVPEVTTAEYTDKLNEHKDYLTKNPVVLMQLLEAVDSAVANPLEISEEELMLGASLFESYLFLTDGKRPEEAAQATGLTTLEKDSYTQKILEEVKKEFSLGKIGSFPIGVEDVQAYAIANSMIEVESPFMPDNDFANPFAPISDVPTRDMSGVKVKLPFNAKRSFLTLNSLGISAEGVTLNDDGTPIQDENVPLEAVENLYLNAVSTLNLSPSSMEVGDPKEIAAAKAARQSIIPVTDTDTVFVIGDIAKKGDVIPISGKEKYTINSITPRVVGMNGYATQAAINLGKTVYVYHSKVGNPQSDMGPGWYLWDTNENKFIPTVTTPRVPDDFALYVDSNANEAILSQLLAVKDSPDVIISATEEEATDAYLDWVLHGGDTSVKNVLPIKPKKADPAGKALASIATKYIGFGIGIKDSPVALYKDQAAELANTGKYTPRDVVFVKSDNKIVNVRPEIVALNQQYTLQEAIKALEAGAILLTTSEKAIHTKPAKPEEAYSTNISYAQYLGEYGLTQKGEKALYNGLKNLGYTYKDVVIEGFIHGSWSKKNNTLEKLAAVRDALANEFKGKQFVNYKETKTANSAAVLQYLANYTLPEAGNKPDAEKEFLFDALYGEDSIEYLDENFKSCAI